MTGRWGISGVVWWLSAVAAFTSARASAVPSNFHFDRDTFAFANQTVFEYHEGHASLRKPSSVKKDAYNRHCFVMCRTAMQFKKFARFDPHSAPLDDTSLSARVRAVTHRSAWEQPSSEDQRIVFPGYKNLREMSNARRELLQKTIGHGWPSYFRISNARMMFQQSARYQEETHAHLNAALARGQVFVGFLTTYPRLSINHSVLAYAILFTILIIQNRLASWSGLPKRALFLFKGTGTLSAALCACTRFTANGSSENDSLKGARVAESPSPLKPAPPVPTPPPEPLPPNPTPVPPVGR